MGVQPVVNRIKRYRRLNRPSRGQTLALALVVPAFVFFGSTVRGMYDDGISSKQRAADQAECRKEIHECRNREMDDIKARLLQRESTKP